MVLSYEAVTLGNGELILCRLDWSSAITDDGEQTFQRRGFR